MFPQKSKSGGGSGMSDLLGSGAQMYMNHKYGPKLMVAQAIANAVTSKGSGRKSPQPQYAPQQGGYPPPQGYGGYPPPQQGGYPPPQQGGYPPPQQGGYPPPQQGGYLPPQQGGYPPPQQGAYGGSPPPQSGYGGYPPQHGGHGSSHGGHGGSGSGLVATGTSLLNQAGKLVGKAANTAGSAMDKYSHGGGGYVTQLFAPGNVIQLVSRVTGRALQIMQTPQGQLFLDGNGSEGPQSMNAHFTVHPVGENIVMLYNQTNYLCIQSGQLILYNVPPGQAPPPTCHLKVKPRAEERGAGSSSGHSRLVSLKSMMEPGCHVAVLPSGQLKSAATTSGKDADAQFAVKLVYSPAGGGPSAPGMVPPGRCPSPQPPHPPQPPYAPPPY